MVADCLSRTLTPITSRTISTDSRRIHNIDTADDALKTFDLFKRGMQEADTGPLLTKRYNSSDSGAVTNVAADENGNSIKIEHRPAEQLGENERVAFSLKNCTGELVRVHSHSSLETGRSSSLTAVTYLDHMQLMPLSFPATETLIKNLKAVEVPFIGDQNQNIASNHQRHSESTSHEMDLQIPGFRWIRDISFDKTGKHFLALTPRSLSVQAKVDQDWRLRNALQVLAEVNSINGGRRLMITSPFEVINRTNHPIFLGKAGETGSQSYSNGSCLNLPFHISAISPDPRHSPPYTRGDGVASSIGGSGNESCDEKGFVIEKINPDESQNISFLLLENALRMNGNHLGSMWIRPDQASCDDLNDPLMSRNKSDMSTGAWCTVGYPSRPVQLAKVVHESSVIFRDSHGDPAIANEVASGVEVSCPIFDRNQSRSSTPFCYVVEVKRSPFRRSTQAESIKPETEAAVDSNLNSPRTGKVMKNMFSKGINQERADIHAPIAYQFFIHPPLVLENLLPERGRFELMDANSRNVLWWGSLEAGERVPIYTVGLDAPLLLLVNLGFCKTAVGDAALIHHGGGDGLFRAGWNSIGSAVKTSKERVKKTLHTMTESKDNRGAKRVGMIKTGTGNVKQKDVANRKVGQLGHNTENDMIESSGGGVPRRNDAYGVEDIATELNVIDSLGQRLTLLIDNVLGSGGQRHVSLYSPFWIVSSLRLGVSCIFVTASHALTRCNAQINTTEHSLRYKQEKALSYVSGTVLSAEKDGSKPVDGGFRCHIEEDDDLLVESGLESELGSLSTVFSGRPGALSLMKDRKGNATNPALFAALISEDLPLRVLSKLAFMFNFQDSIYLGGSPRLCIQLADTRDVGSRYQSAWSSGFGLESVGVTQIVGMLCKDGRGLEVNVSISIAPGRLSNYTKIVRICPRYIVVNQLPRTIVSAFLLS